MWQLVSDPALLFIPFMSTTEHVTHSHHVTPTLSRSAAFGAELGGPPDWSRKKALQRGERTIHLSKNFRTRTWWDFLKATLTKGQFQERVLQENTLRICFSLARTIRSLGEAAGFLGKVGHRLIMELHHLTINHQSSLGPAQQKGNEHLPRSGHGSKCLRLHSFTEPGSILGAVSLFCTLEAAPDRRSVQHSEPRWGGTLLVQTRPYTGSIKSP